MKSKSIFALSLCLAASACTHAADFKKALALTLKREGGYVNDSLNKGGETYRGVTRNFHPEWEGWILVDSAKSRLGYASTLNCSREEAAAMDRSLVREKRLTRLVIQLYKTEYWDALVLDTVQSQKKADSLFDWAVRKGVFAVRHPKDRNP